MMRRAVLLLAALLALAAMAATPASAQSAPGRGADDDYTSACSPLGLSKTSVSPGETIVVSGTAANAGSVSIVLDGTTLLGTTNAAAFTHAFSKSVTLPSPLSEGPHKIQAFQVGEVAGCADPQVATISVLALTIAAPPLARTGSPDSTMALVRFGIGLLAAGGMAILVSRRRRASATANA
jgi:hypothetical protein